MNDGDGEVKKPSRTSFILDAVLLVITGFALVVSIAQSDYDLTFYLILLGFVFGVIVTVMDIRQLVAYKNATRQVGY